MKEKTKNTTQQTTQSNDQKDQRVACSWIFNLCRVTQGLKQW